jgi:hypothetical protein
MGSNGLAFAAVCLAGRQAIVLGESRGEITSKADVEHFSRVNSPEEVGSRRTEALGISRATEVFKRVR